MNQKRSEMDPLDALILYGRGLSLEEMADYDDCTQAAVLRALLPQMDLKKHRRGRGVTSASQHGMSARDLAARLGTSNQYVFRVLKEVTA